MESGRYKKDDRGECVMMQTEKAALEPAATKTFDDKSILTESADDRICKKHPQGDYIILGCKNHPKLRFHTKNVGCIGYRTIFANQKWERITKEDGQRVNRLLPLPKEYDECLDQCDDETKFHICEDTEDAPGVDSITSPGMQETKRRIAAIAAKRDESEPESVTAVEEPAPTSAQEMQFHPAAEIFPQMIDEEFDALVDDIKANGLLEDIVTLDGRILDGCNRYRACIEAGVTPRFKEYNGNVSPVDYVLSRNLHRRHLSESQRGMVAARIANLKHGQKKADVQICTSVPEAAEKLNVSPRTVKTARKVIEHGTPLLVKEVESGKIAVSKAAKLIDWPVPTAEPEPPRPRKDPELVKLDRALGRIIEDAQSLTCKIDEFNIFAGSLGLRGIPDFTSSFNVMVIKDLLCKLNDHLALFGCDEPKADV
jgi:hypothetical protein